MDMVLVRYMSIQCHKLWRINIQLKISLSDRKSFWPGTLVYVLLQYFSEVVLVLISMLIIGSDNSDNITIILCLQFCKLEDNTFTIVELP